MLSKDTHSQRKPHALPSMWKMNAHVGTGKTCRMGNKGVLGDEEKPMWVTDTCVMKEDIKLFF